ncbi:MAG: hypothetical protein HC898_12850, partial [Phycisphaerales bacterium]|nr:hypothetical protein [Phycisphaerales bacterium]
PGPTVFADTGKVMLDLQPLLAHLAQKYQATNLWVEGGATLAGALLAQGLVDQLCAIIAPKLLGDAQALGAVQGFVVEHMDQTRPLTLQSVRKLGDDLLLTYSLTETRPM